MKKIIVNTLTVLVLLTAVSVAAPIERVDITPAFLVNLSDNHSGSAMGGALTTDLFFDRGFAIRTTMGYTKERYFPSSLDYSKARYGFWLAVAPYAELNVGSVVRPFVTLISTFSHRSTADNSFATFRPGSYQSSNAPVARIQPANVGANSLSLGSTLGVKVHLMGDVSLLAEVTHHFYTTTDQNFDSADYGLEYSMYGYDWDKSPTYMSLGLTYSFLP